MKQAGENWHGDGTPREGWTPIATTTFRAITTTTVAAKNRNNVRARRNPIRERFGGPEPKKCKKCLNFFKKMLLRPSNFAGPQVMISLERKLFPPPEKIKRLPLLPLGLLFFYPPKLLYQEKQAPNTKLRTYE